MSGRLTQTFLTAVAVLYFADGRCESDFRTKFKDLREILWFGYLRPTPRVPQFLLQILDPNSLYFDVVLLVWSIHLRQGPKNTKKIWPIFDSKLPKIILKSLFL